MTLNSNNKKPYDRVYSANILFCIIENGGIEDAEARDAIVEVIRTQANAEGGLTNLGITPERWEKAIGSPYQASSAKRGAKLPGPANG